MVSPQTIPPPIDLPTVEPGYTTTEFWLTSISGFALAIMDAIAAFGSVIKPEQRGAVVSVISASIPLLVAVYAIARSIRKKGTIG